MKKQNSRMPYYWRRSLWEFFSQPITLDLLPKKASPSADSSAGWKLWQEGGPSRDYVKKSVAVLMVGSISLMVALLLIFRNISEVDIPLLRILLGVTIGIGWGIALSIGLGVNWADFWGIAYGVIWGVGVSSNTAGVAWGVAWGGAWAVTGSFISGVPWSVAWSAFWSLSWGVVLGIATGISTGAGWAVAGGLLGGLAGFGSALITTLRIPSYFLEASLQVLLFWCEDVQRPWSLRYSPVLHHNLSYFPHAFLGRHILKVANADPLLARRAVDACLKAPGQRLIGRRVIAQIQARELERAASSRSFGEIVGLQGFWFPGRPNADPFLAGFAEIARYMISTETTSIPYQLVKKLERARVELESLKHRLLESDSDLAKVLIAGPFTEWESAISHLHRSAQSKAFRQLPNAFRAKEPLSPDHGREVFRGREEFIRTIESLLGEPGRGCSMALLGPRRTGKTSLLKMLPLLLPDAICILFDLQDNPIHSSSALFAALSRRALEQAQRDRQLNLPRLPNGPPFEAGSRWLESLDELPGGLRVLLCIDEFERLESLFPGSRRELLQLLGLIRATIQHRQRVRVLLSGAAPFEELDALWNDHLINAREIRIGFLDREAAIGLLRKPIPEFPDEAVPEEVAQGIFERTGGQPNLVQLYGSLLVTRLNEQNRRQAEPEDVTRVEEDVLTQETYYFRNILQEAPPAARAALIALAHEQGPEMDAATRRWLRRRLLVTDDGQLTMPVFGAWIRAEEGG